MKYIEHYRKNREIHDIEVSFLVKGTKSANH